MLSNEVLFSFLINMYNIWSSGVWFFILVWVFTFLERDAYDLA